MSSFSDEKKTKIGLFFGIFFAILTNIFCKTQPYIEKIRIINGNFKKNIATKMFIYQNKYICIHKYMAKK